MRAKKPLLVLVLTLALIAVALILPAAAYGKSAAKAVSWVKVNTNCRLPDSNFPDLTFHGATVARVEQLADESLRGRVIVKVFREFYPMGTAQAPTLFRYTVKSKYFASPDWWDYEPPGVSHADFFIAAAGNWPADLGPVPDWWAGYRGAAVADFVAYVPITQYPENLPWLAFYTPYGTPSIPYRFMFIDSGKSGRADVMLNWLFVGLPGMPWMPTVWTVPIQSGNIQVHVGT